MSLQRFQNLSKLPPGEKIENLIGKECFRIYPHNFFNKKCDLSFTFLTKNPELMTCYIINKKKNGSFEICIDIDKYTDENTDEEVILYKMDASWDDGYWIEYSPVIYSKYRENLIFYFKYLLSNAKKIMPEYFSNVDIQKLDKILKSKKLKL